MPSKPKRFCSYPGCSELTTERFCEQHRKQEQKQYDNKRGTANERGYNYRWQKYSEWFLKQPENVLCKLHLDDGCAEVSQCVDHIDPPDGPNDPRFWDTKNHQGACLHCNSVKGHRFIKGDAKPFGS